MYDLPLARQTFSDDNLFPGNHDVAEVSLRLNRTPGGCEFTAGLNRRERIGTT